MSKRRKRHILCTTNHSWISKRSHYNYQGNVTQETSEM